TGAQRGVMWTRAAVVGAPGGGGIPARARPPSGSVEEQRERIAGGASPRLLPACPLMHGTGQFTAINALTGGGAIVTCDGHSFDPDALFATVSGRGVQAIAIVGVAVAEPMLRA